MTLPLQLYGDIQIYRLWGCIWILTIKNQKQGNHYKIIALRLPPAEEVLFAVALGI